MDICFRLPQGLRKELARPYGFLFVNNEALFEFLKRTKSNFYTVGDVVTSTVLERGLLPKIAIVDGKTKRVIKTSMVDHSGFRILRVTNEPGLIRGTVLNVLRNALESNERLILEVEGEEDLLVIPLVIFAKEGDLVLYGQPNAGAVVLEVNALSRLRVKALFENFEADTC